MDYRIYPPDEILVAAVALPLSKSISARALIMAYLTPGALALPAAEETADCTDTRVLRYILENHRNGNPDNVGAAGTAMRFLTALFAAMPGHEAILDGNERMHHRPIGPLVDALRAMGAKIEYLGEDGFPPLRISGTTLAGGELTVESGLSSQFISAMMMVAPVMAAPLRIILPPDMRSMPYINMTAEMMRRRGIDVETDRDSVAVANTPYRPCPSDAETDWSAATFWYEIAALTAGWVTVRGPRGDELQGDRAVASLFERMGVLSEFTEEGLELSATPDLYSRLDADMADMPDAVPAVVVTAGMIGMPLRLTGVGALRHKESDRLAALMTEMRKFGVMMEMENDDTISWDGRRMPVTELPAVDTYGDHRLAMAFAPAAVFIPGMVVRDVEVVDKSYPAFWSDLAGAGFRLADASMPVEEPVAD